MNSIKKSDLALSFTKLSDPQSPLLRLLYSSLVSLIISMSRVFLPVFLSLLLAHVTFVLFVLSLPTDTESCRKLHYSGRSSIYNMVLNAVMQIHQSSLREQSKHLTQAFYNTDENMAWRQIYSACTQSGVSKRLTACRTVQGRYKRRALGWWNPR